MDLGNNGNFKSALLRSNGSSFKYNERKKRMRMYFLSQRHPHWSVGWCLSSCGLGWVGRGGRNPLGDAFPHKHNFFFSFEVLNYSEGGVTHHARPNRVSKHNSSSASNLFAGPAGLSQPGEEHDQLCHRGHPRWSFKSLLFVSRRSLPRIRAE